MRVIVCNDEDLSLKYGGKDIWKNTYETPSIRDCIKDCNIGPDSNRIIIIHPHKTEKNEYLDMMNGCFKEKIIKNLKDLFENYKMIFVSSSAEGWETLESIRSYLEQTINTTEDFLEGFFYLEMLELAFTEGDNPDRIVAELEISEEEEEKIKINSKEITEQMGLKWKMENDKPKITLVEENCSSEGRDDTVCFNSDIISKIKKALKALKKVKKKLEIKKHWCKIRESLLPLLIYMEILQECGDSGNIKKEIVNKIDSLIKDRVNPALGDFLNEIEIEEQEAGEQTVENQPTIKENFYEFLNKYWKEGRENLKNSDVKNIKEIKEENISNILNNIFYNYGDFKIWFSCLTKAFHDLIDTF